MTSTVSSQQGRPTRSPASVVAARRQLVRVVNQHWPVIAVLLAGAFVRLVTDLSYSALLTPDSWTYVKMAFAGSPAQFAPSRPLGYPLLLEPLSIGGESFATVTAVQHLVGLAVGVLVYLLLYRLGVPRWAATLATAVVVLDSWVVTMHEQSVMAETFFTLFLTGGVYLAMAVRQRPWTLAVGGALFGAAAALRTMALFAVPIFFLYTLWAGKPWRARVLGTAGLLLPLLIYASAQGLATGWFGMTQSSGWFLYGRVASLTDCDPRKVPPSTKRLCVMAGERGKAAGFDDQASYTFKRESPARQLFGGMRQGSLERRQKVNRLLGKWARAAIVNQPTAYVSGVAGEFAKYLGLQGLVSRSEVGERSSSVRSSYLLTNPGEPFFGGYSELDSEQKASFTNLRAKYVPWYERDAEASDALHAYQAWFQAPGGFIAALCVLALIPIGLALAFRRPLPRTKEAFLLIGSALAILLGAVAFSSYQARFVPTLMPLLIAGLALVTHDLVSAVRKRPGRQPASRGRHRPRRSRTLADSLVTRSRPRFESRC